MIILGKYNWTLKLVSQTPAVVGKRAPGSHITARLGSIDDSAPLQFPNTKSTASENLRNPDERVYFWSFSFLDQAPGLKCTDDRTSRIVRVSTFRDGLLPALESKYAHHQLVSRICGETALHSLALIGLFFKTMLLLSRK